MIMLRSIKLSQLRPNNLFLNERKVSSVRAAWKGGKAGKLPPILVAKIESDLCLIDGHSRAFVAWENGADAIACELKSLEEIEGSAEVYKKIYRLGIALDIVSIADLAERILPDPEYRDRWIQFCESLDSTP